MTYKDSISNYQTKVKGYKNASSSVNRVCGCIPRIPPESATEYDKFDWMINAQVRLERSK